MLRSQIDIEIDAALRGRHLLLHPFYRRWEAGDLGRQELAAYAGQYRHWEATLPETLEQLAPRLRGDAAVAVRANLADERGTPTHLELFDDFVTAVGGATDDSPTPATAALVGVYRELANAHPVAGLAALAAYEVQAPDVATTKAAGLRTHYGLGDVATRFWDVHTIVEGSHATSLLDALSVQTADATTVRHAARVGADAWWSFLDEREAAA